MGAKMKATIKQQGATPNTSNDVGSDGAVAGSAAKFDRIRRAHQSEVAEDYVEMIAELIEETGEAKKICRRKSY